MSQLKTAEHKKTGRILVLGLGNTIVSDDGVGIHAVEKFECEYGARLQNVCCETASKSGVELLPLFEGYEHAVVVDAIMTTDGSPGDVYQFELDDLTCTGHAVSPHSLNLFSTIELGRICGLEMPEKVHVVAVEIEDNVNFGEEFTPAVKSSVKKVIAILMKLIENLN